MDLLPISPVLAWFLLGIACFAVELAMPGFIVFFFGIGAWCVALTFFFIKVSLTTQLMIFLVTTLASLLLLRSFLNKIFQGRTLEEEDSFIISPGGATGVVIEAIVPPAEGRIKYGGSFWRASSQSVIAEGAIVDIIEQKDLLLKVQPAKHEG